MLKYIGSLSVRISNLLSTVCMSVVCIAILTPLISAAELPLSDIYTVRHINISNGLPHNFVDDIYRDSRGFMWFGLGGAGLVRYDGNEFVKFSPTSTRCIAGDFVKNVVEDTYQRLWVATENGLSIIDLTTMKPIDVAAVDTRLDVYSKASIHSVYVDSQDRLWIINPEGICSVTFTNDGTVKQFSTLKYGKQTYNSRIVKDIDGDGKVWTEINQRVCKLEPCNSSQIIVDTLNVNIPAEALLNDVIVKNHIVWIATDKGLVCHKSATEADKLYRHSELDPNSISQDFVTSLAVTPDDQLIVATLNGINIYRPDTDDFESEHASHRVYNVGNRLNSNFINCMLVDENNIWIGTESGGVNLLTPKSLLTVFDSYDINNPASISQNPVNAIYEDRNHTLWIGTVEGGLNRKKQGMNGFEHFTTHNTTLPHNSVSAITADPSGRLWVGTWGGGLAVIDPEYPSRSYLNLSYLGTYGQRPYIGMLLHDPINNGIWIGCSQGLFFYDLASGRIIEPFIGAEQNVQGCLNAVIDESGHLWLGCMNGLYDINLKVRTAKGWEYRLLHNKLDAPDSGLQEKMSCVYLATDGTLWVGSDIHGLYHRTTDGKGNETFTNITTDDGLVQNVVLGITEDDSGRIWVATNNGLSCYYPETSKFVNYSRAQGLASETAYWNATQRLRNGHLLFGTVEGLLDIDPSKIKDDNSRHKVRFTRLVVDNQPIEYNQDISPLDISVADKIYLHERNQSFSIEFSALNYSQDPNCRYYYMLKGFDKEWIRLPEGRNFVTYTNLHPGEYTLMVSYHPEDVTDDVEISTLDIVVQRYFYHTVWFFILIALVIVGAAWMFYRWRIHNIQAQKAELEKAVEQRTHEINEQKQMLEERTMRIQELTVDRLSFFTNLTHEFRTPITLIMGPVHRAVQLCKDKAVTDQLRYVERNARYLLNLVNQLMDFRKIESGKMEIVRSQGNFTDFLNEIIESFRTIVSERNITLTSHVRIANPFISFDKDAMRKLLNNFLSNATKYTPDGGTITVFSTILPMSCTQSYSDQLYISVSDTGDGIDPNDIEKVFDQFYQGKTYIKYPNMAASSGIGLYLCKCIVEAYGGRITARNNPVKGCTFRIVLPVPSIEDEKIDNAQTYLPVAAADTKTESSKRLTILVVEDNNDMRGYIKSILAEKYDVLEAENGKEALDLLVDNNVDFIVCDLMMPVMDGMEFVKKAKENFATSHIPILMLTARTTEESKIESYRQGVDEYIFKPFSEELILARIQNILSNKQRQQRKFAVAYNTDELVMEESRDKKFLDQIMEVVKNNYKNSYFDVGDFSEALGVSRSFLNKKMQSLVGQSSSEFIRNYRLNTAHRLIILNRDSHNMNISEIAYDVGFNDSKYFTRCFTKHFGITPSGLLAAKDK